MIKFSNNNLNTHDDIKPIEENNRLTTSDTNQELGRILKEDDNSLMGIIHQFVDFLKAPVE